MPTFVALDNQQHKSLKVSTQTIEAQGAEERMVPVVLSEFLKLAVHYPIAFTKNMETGKFLCVALLGFEEKENLFWQNNSWDSIYTPLNIMRQPFFIGNDNGTGVICINSESPCLSTQEGEAIFDGDGADASYLQKIKVMLAELLQGEAQTAEFIQSLLELKLIMPMALDITFANQQEQRVEGLYTIDEDQLAGLSGEQLLLLQQKEYLKPIYTMIVSLSHIYALIHKKNQRLAQA